VVEDSMDTKKKTVKRVSLRAFWGNDDAESEIRLPLSKWKKILDGLEYKKGGYAWYEGRRFHVVWRFNKPNKRGSKDNFSIDADDGSECIADRSLSNIYVRILKNN